ncbi:MAG: CapA family protein [Chromatiaceae bacterium]|nr:CapA family protein [Chromatiaceae bacterium]MCF7994141.1 CapA family protein [Chromatiaceae bacterium]MCF8016214.1 CapA family protein [Chromatiaceae bacterium]
MDKIKLTGDWAPSSRKVEKLDFDETLVVNLEGPVLDHNANNHSRLKKAGPSLFHTSLPKSKQKGIFTLANNHFFDYGQSGYDETIKNIETQGWLYVGAGLNRDHATKPLVFESSGKKIGILARCEIQFGVAQENKPGVAGFDATVYDQIRKLKNETDFIIVSVHAAAEMLPWPSPHRQDTWRALIDAGADVVHGHHAHVPQGWEVYRGGLIFYGLGNFCVDPGKWAWHPNGLWSLSPVISLSDGPLAMSPVTTVVEDYGQVMTVRASTKDEFESHREYLDECKRPLADRVFLEGLWQEAAMRMYDAYYADWLGFDVPVTKLLYRSLRKTLGAIKHQTLKKNRSDTRESRLQFGHLLRYHLFACESHNDAISTALGVLSGEVADLRTDATSAMLERHLINP